MAAGVPRNHDIWHAMQPYCLATILPPDPLGSWARGIIKMRLRNVRIPLLLAMCRGRFGVTHGSPMCGEGGGVRDAGRVS